jgi:LPS export ABC transporter protein LptC
MKTSYSRISGLAFILLLTGCSFNYEEGKIAEDLSETVPETVLMNFVQVRTVEGKPDYRVYGTKAEAYGKKKETVITDVVFQDFDRDGTVETEGIADRITYYSESENAELSGNLQFYNTNEEVEIRAEYLFWNEAEETLTTEEREPVTLVKTNGTVVTGTGFSARGASKTIVFTGGVEGTWVEDEEDEQEPGDE